MAWGRVDRFGRKLRDETLFGIRTSGIELLTFSTRPEPRSDDSRSTPWTPNTVRSVMRRRLWLETSLCEGGATCLLNQLVCDFSVFAYRGGHLLAEPFRACLMCGLVWTYLEPEELRTFVNEHGSAKTKIKLSSVKKGHPEQDLV